MAQNFSGIPRSNIIESVISKIKDNKSVRITGSDNIGKTTIMDSIGHRITVSESKLMSIKISLFDKELLCENKVDDKLRKTLRRLIRRMRQEELIEDDNNISSLEELALHLKQNHSIVLVVIIDNLYRYGMNGNIPFYLKKLIHQIITDQNLLMIMSDNQSSYIVNDFMLHEMEIVEVPLFTMEECCIYFTRKAYQEHGLTIDLKTSTQLVKEVYRETLGYPYLLNDIVKVFMDTIASCSLEYIPIFSELKEVILHSIEEVKMSHNKSLSRLLTYISRNPKTSSFLYNYEAIELSKGVAVVKDDQLWIREMLSTGIFEIINSEGSKKITFRNSIFRTAYIKEFKKGSSTLLTNVKPNCAQHRIMEYYNQGKNFKIILNDFASWLHSSRAGSGKNRLDVILRGVKKISQFSTIALFMVDGQKRNRIKCLQSVGLKREKYMSDSNGTELRSFIGIFLVRKYC